MVLQRCLRQGLHKVVLPHGWHPAVLVNGYTCLFTQSCSYNRFTGLFETRVVYIGLFETWDILGCLMYGLLMAVWDLSYPGLFRILNRSFRLGLHTGLTGLFEALASRDCLRHVLHIAVWDICLHMVHRDFILLCLIQSFTSQRCLRHRFQCCLMVMFHRVVRYIEITVQFENRASQYI